MGLGAQRLDVLSLIVLVCRPGDPAFPKLVALLSQTDTW
jgi:hypothetical protein